MGMCRHERCCTHFRAVNLVFQSGSTEAAACAVHAVQRTVRRRRVVQTAALTPTRMKHPIGGDTERAEGLKVFPALLGIGLGQLGHEDYPFFRDS